MFGQHDQPHNDTIPDQSINGALQGDDNQTVSPTGDAHQYAPQHDTHSQDWQHPGAPTSGEKTITLPPHHPHHAQPQAGPQPDDQHTNNHHSDATNDLIDIKQQALKKLSPLVGHLDQSPEERFRTTMMMIQASDDQSLVKAAYEAADQIEDEKARAQALLDIVNEINYFTQSQS